MRCITFEGLGGAGKTTYAERLAKGLNVPCMPMPSTPPDSIHHQMLRAAPPESRAWIGMLERLAMIKRLESGKWKNVDLFTTDCLLGHLDRDERMVDIFFSVIDVKIEYAVFIDITHAQSIKHRALRDGADSILHSNFTEQDDIDYTNRLKWKHEHLPCRSIIVDGMRPLDEVWTEIEEALCTQSISGITPT